MVVIITKRYDMEEGTMTAPQFTPICRTRYYEKRRAVLYELAK
jgi:hypothetical protein